MARARHIRLFFSDAGGGHRVATKPLKISLAARFPEWRVDVINLQEILKSSYPLFILTGVPERTINNRSEFYSYTAACPKASFSSSFMA